MNGQEGRERQDWRVLLRTGDPLQGDSALSSDAARVIRRTVVAATREAAMPLWSWPRPLTVALTIAATLVLGIILGRQLPSRNVVPAKPPTVERRQMQFETPGGTRIIWTFSSDFDL
jgi:hypothetical protein